MQDANEIINSAKDSGGSMLTGPNLFFLEGNGETNDLRILTADECFKNNIAAFTYNIPHGYMMLGVFTNREGAEDAIDVIRSLYRDEKGDVLNI